MGGAIFSNGGILALTNDTFTANTAQGGAAGSALNGSGVVGQGLGGSVFNRNGTLTILNCTFSLNTAADGGRDVYNLSDGTGNTGTAHIANSILGQSGAIGATDFFSSTFNGSNAPVDTGVKDLMSNPGNFPGSGLIAATDPMLGALAANGGPTNSMALQFGSPAIDAGDSTAPGLPSTDQRGFARISGVAVDIGAFEVQDPLFSTTALANGTYGTVYSQTITATATGGAAGPFTFAVTAGALPPGLSLASAGALSGTATAAGSFSFTVTATDSAGFTASQSYTLTIAQADLYVTAAVNSKTYGQTASDTGTLSGVVNGDSITASFASAGDAASAPVGTGSYTITATLADPNNQLANYTVHETDAILTVNPAVLTVTAGNATRSYGAANPAFSYAITGFVNNDPASVVSGTPALSTTATPGSAPGSYAITADVISLSAANYTFSPVNGTLTVTPASLSAAAVNFSATAGAPFRGTVATFATPDQFDGAAAFSAVITWGDGSTSNGIITGSNGTFTVCGSHTYAAAGGYTVGLQLSNPNTQAATANDTAKVTSLGLGVTRGLTGGIGFWENSNGQTLIKRFNGGPTATALGNWLAASFPNLYGASAGSNDLAGKTNAQVAAYFQALFAPPGSPVRATALQVLAGGAGTTAAALLQGFSSPGGNQLQAQVLAVALNVYATTSSLGGTAGVAYGFKVSATGLGARSVSVGKDGAAFGVANNSVLTVYALLVAVNKQAVNGVLYGGNAALQAQCANLCNTLNAAGSIG
jgi:hypothetical protein